MRFTQPQTGAQLDLQALHRARQRLIPSSTAIVNQARAFLFECGLTIGAGPAYFVRDMPSILVDDGNSLTPAMCDLLQEQWQEYRSIEAHSLQLRRRIEAIARADGVTTRLIPVPDLAH
ncbi:hypothetical protein [Burkholderia contaminans]|uniref:hypothetical protein n=1 Tax=Burkholderia contaminans TaxID=488447 RepID=UPI00158C140F|nr:hypothetical protein [Burkholderia contaminans]